MTGVGTAQAGDWHGEVAAYIPLQPLGGLYSAHEECRHSPPLPFGPRGVNGLRKTDGPPRLRYARLKRTVDVVGDVPQVLREAQECADLVEGADELRSLTPTTL